MGGAEDEPRNRKISPLTTRHHRETTQYQLIRWYYKTTDLYLAHIHDTYPWVGRWWAGERAQTDPNHKAYPKKQIQKLVYIFVRASIILVMWRQSVLLGGRSHTVRQMCIHNDCCTYRVQSTIIPLGSYARRNQVLVCTRTSEVRIVDISIQLNTRTAAVLLKRVSVVHSQWAVLYLRKELPSTLEITLVVWHMAHVNQRCQQHT